ncbi:hypothetical protein Goari_019627 [Gossypium aridum]|uniref:peroxidase n=1 Tax=Gossypium aridum TaxID=34290 RepID=A0A7J8WTK3_GOSAI|nr:hypothetical protein [Gossypium aridum]
MQKGNTQIALILASLIISNILVLVVSQGQLRVGFYSKTCPNAESIIRKVVQKAVADNPRNAAILLRLHFYDCFVQGCDGSILIRNDEDGELKAQGNLGVVGFDIIDGAKARLENLCPGIVSCADIVSLAARDAVNGPFYDVPTGRRDGRVSKMSLAANLADVDDSINVLKSKFKEKGLSDKDLVLLSGGDGSDPAINPGFLPQLKDKCPFNGDVNVRIPLDS